VDHEFGLIATITIAVAAAFLGGFLAARVGLPAIVGYLLAGVALGPFTPGFVVDSAIITQLAEIGIVLLMFGVGIHFSLRDLLDVRAIAIPGAVFQIAVATTLSLGVAIWWGWSLGPGLVLGLAISVASTVVLLRALEERNELETTQGRIAIGWLIVEDIFTVLVLVLLPSLALAIGGAATGDAPASITINELLWALLLTLGKVGALAALMALVGARVVPWLLVQVARTGSRELFTLGVLAVALGVAYGSSVIFGISLALGAFLAGLVVSESDLSYQAAADALPMRDAFAVLFFVSVGMLFEPSAILSAPGALLAVLAIILIGKPLAAFVIVIAYGYPLRAALTVAAGLAQIGEFSFILAEMARSLGMLPIEGYYLLIAAAILSITLNPVMFRAIGPLDAWLRSRAKLARYLVWRNGAMARMPAHKQAEELRGHAVICGFGRVGSVVGEALQRRGFTFVVIDQKRRLVEKLRDEGIMALYGDASNAILLDRVNLPQARTLVVAISDPPTTRQIIEYARRINPRLDIVSRTNSRSERNYLLAHGVTELVIGETELALEMTRHTLQRFGVSSLEIAAMLQRIRLQEREEAT
jgi:CPA2 family monovalent cation:H+ antiporter-2